MNLGSILDGLRSAPAVTRPVKFAVGHLTDKAHKTRAFAEAVLVHVDEEERAAIAPAAAEYLARKFQGKPIDPKDRDAEEMVRFMALALRDKADPAAPFANGGVDQLRPAFVYGVLQFLADEYRALIEAEYKAHPSDEDDKRLREQAAGK